MAKYNCVNCGIIPASQVAEDKTHLGMGMCWGCTCTVFVIPQRRPTKRAADVKPRRASKVKSRKVSRG